jgi:hypothetical protein
MQLVLANVRVRVRVRVRSLALVPSSVRSVCTACAAERVRVCVRVRRCVVMRKTDVTSM